MNPNPNGPRYGVCFQCGSPDHFKLDCPDNPINQVVKKEGAKPKDDKGDDAQRPNSDARDGARGSGGGGQGRAGVIGGKTSSSQLAGLMYGAGHTTKTMYGSRRSQSDGSDDGGQGQGDGDKTRAVETGSALERMESDMKTLEEFGIIPNPDAPVNAVHVPCLVGNVIAGAIVDSGSSLTIISARMADILEATEQGKRRPSRVVAELFGNGTETVTFEECMSVEISMCGKTGPVEVQIYPGMALDVLVGHDSLMGCSVVIDYQNEKVSSGGHSVRFGRRIHILKALLEVQTRHRNTMQALAAKRAK